ncbi:MAG TPA: GNAT family N-acetyltransferase [Bryobacteraceae bacterium]|nr:GNAT family N-acetyltransferase [Bryobacteraceae bacterium]
MLYRAVEANLRGAMRCYARVSPRGEARDYPGLTVASCGMNCAVFNSAMLTRPADSDDLRRLLAMSQLHFRQRSLGWTFWLCEDMLTDSATQAVRNALRDAGLALIAQPPGMYASALQPPRRAAARIAIREVNNPAVMLDFAHLSSVIFNLPFGTARSIYAVPELWTGDMRGWVGYLDSQAVCIATVVIAGGVAGVYSVGTLPAFQCRGYAESIMRHGLARAREDSGIEETVLQSTPEGMSLYTRLGYVPVTRFGVYLQEGPAVH